MIYSNQITQGLLNVFRPYRWIPRVGSGLRSSILYYKCTVYIFLHTTITSTAPSSRVSTFEGGKNLMRWDLAKVWIAKLFFLCVLVTPYFWFVVHIFLRVLYFTTAHTSLQPICPIYILLWFHIPSCFSLLLYFSTFPYLVLPRFASLYSYLLGHYLSILFYVIRDSSLYSLWPPLFFCHYPHGGFFNNFTVTTAAFHLIEDSVRYPVFFLFHPKMQLIECD